MAVGVGPAGPALILLVCELLRTSMTLGFSLGHLLRVYHDMMDLEQSIKLQAINIIS